MVESVGRILQQARLARKLEIEDVAERTKIRPDRLIDLEADEYSHFPNLTYAKSFLAKYARFLGSISSMSWMTSRSHQQFPWETINT